MFSELYVFSLPIQIIDFQLMHIFMKIISEMIHSKRKREGEREKRLLVSEWEWDDVYESKFMQTLCVMFIFLLALPFDTCSHSYVICAVVGIATKQPSAVNSFPKNFHTTRH